jgi:hypothetical protein
MRELIANMRAWDIGEGIALAVLLILAVWLLCIVIKRGWFQ